MNATALADLSADDLAALLEEQRAAYEQLKAQGLELDLTRGKPSAQQLDLADDLLRLPTSTKDASGVDVRNYGGLEGLRELLGGHPPQSRRAHQPSRHPFRCRAPRQGWYSFTLLPP